jgi:septal ring factor EnvC (AmiA/AmiB activator)
LIDYQNTTPAPEKKSSTNSPVMMIVSIVLAVALIVVGVLYGMEIGKLNKANDNIASLEADVADLETQLATEKANVDRLETELAAEQAKVTQLTADLAAANDNISSLEDELATANDNIAGLTSDLEDAQAEIASTQAELENASSDLAAALVENEELSDELTSIKAPRHFNSLSELNAWLAMDNTDTLYSTQPPLTRVYILQVRALRDGYILSALTYMTSTTTFSSYCLALIDDTLYGINTYNDTVAPDISGIVTPPPSQPLPRE